MQIDLSTYIVTNVQFIYVNVYAKSEESKYIYIYKKFNL